MRKSALRAFVAMVGLAGLLALFAPAAQASAGATRQLAPPARTGATATTVDPAAVTCHYSSDSAAHTYNGVTFFGFGYAGQYSGVTVIPSTTQVTAAGAEAQCLLKRYGDYNPGTTDGVFGKNSKAAMKAFQTDMNNAFHAGLSEDGLPGPQSWPWLRWFEQ